MPRKSPAPADNFVSGLPEEPVAQPGFVMSDDETLPEEFRKVTRQHISEAAADALPRPKFAYECRLRVLDVWQNDGRIHAAPDWIDRNALTWAEYDEVTKEPAGPAIRVPSPVSPDGFVLCRPGDYVVRQERLMVRGVLPDVSVEVWRRADFEKFFIPVTGIVLDQSKFYAGKDAE